MSAKTIFIIFAALALTGGGVIAARKIGKLTSAQLNETRQMQQREKVARDKRLRWYIDQTKARGETEIILDAPFIDYPGSSLSTRLDDALSAFTAVVAEPIKAQTIARSTGEILTWYKFRIIDMLSENNPYDCSQCEAPPDEFFPIADDEFVMAKHGGSTEIDGIKLTMVDPTFPQFELHRRYFLFVSKNSSGLAVIGIGPNGVFQIHDTASMAPVSRNSHPIKDDIKNRFGGSLDKLKNYTGTMMKTRS